MNPLVRSCIIGISIFVCVGYSFGFFHLLSEGGDNEKFLSHISSTAQEDLTNLANHSKEYWWIVGEGQTEKEKLIVQLISDSNSTSNKPISFGTGFNILANGKTLKSSDILCNPVPDNQSKGYFVMLHKERLNYQTTAGNSIMRCQKPSNEGKISWYKIETSSRRMGLDSSRIAVGSCQIIQKVDNNLLKMQCFDQIFSRSNLRNRNKFEIMAKKY